MKNIMDLLKNNKVELTIDGVKVDVEDLLGEYIQLDNGFNRRWIPSQTFKMLKHKDGWNGAYKEKGYMWQFKFYLEELKRLTKLKNEKSEIFTYERAIFNKKVTISLMENYIRQFKKYYSKHKGYNKNHGWVVKLTANNNRIENRYYGVIITKVNGLSVLNIDRYIEMLNNYIIIISKLNSYDVEPELGMFKEFYDRLYKIDGSICYPLRDAYKGIGAYETMVNMVSSHGCKFYSNKSTTENLKIIDKLLWDYIDDKTVWKLHIKLLDLIEINDNFDLFETEKLKKWRREKSKK